VEQIDISNSLMTLPVQNLRTFLTLVSACNSLKAELEALSSVYVYGPTWTQWSDIAVIVSSFRGKKEDDRIAYIRVHCQLTTSS
jgi:hypothetical protein